MASCGCLEKLCLSCQDQLLQKDELIAQLQLENHTLKQLLPQDHAYFYAHHEVLCHRHMDQVLKCVLGNLDGVDLCRVSGVCKHWRKVAQNNRLWRDLCRRDGILQEDEDSEAQSLDYKAQYKQYTLNKKKWVTGRGVSKHCKQLRGPDGHKFRGHCLALSSRHMFARKPVSPTDPSSIIYVFSTATGAYLHQLHGMTSYVEQLLLAKNDTVAVGIAGDCLKVWNVDSAQVVHTLQSPIHGSKMTLRDTILAVYGDIGLLVYNIERGQLLHQLTGHQTNVHSAAVGKQHIISCDCSDIIKLWDIATGNCRFTWNVLHDFGSVSIDDDTHSAVHWSDYDGLTVWDAQTGLVKANHTMLQGPIFEHVHKSGTLFIHRCEHDCQRIIVVDMRSGQVMGTMQGAGHDAQPWYQPSLLWAGLLVTHGIIGEARSWIDLWDTKSMTYVRQIIDSNLTVLQMRADSNQLHYVGRDNNHMLKFVRFKFDVQA